MSKETEIILAVAGAAAALYLAYEAGQSIKEAGPNAGSSFGDAAGHLIFDAGMVLIAGFCIAAL